MKRRLELLARTYTGKSYKDWLDSQKEAQEGDEWKQYDTPPIPTTYPSRVWINPDKIILAIETYSIEEMYNNPDEPSFDTVDLYIEDEVNISIISTLEELNTKLEEFYNQSNEE